MCTNCLFGEPTRWNMFASKGFDWLFGHQSNFVLICFVNKHLDFQRLFRFVFSVLLSFLTIIDQSQNINVLSMTSEEISLLSEVKFTKVEIAKFSQTFQFCLKLEVYVWARQASNLLDCLRSGRICLNQTTRVCWIFEQKLRKFSLLLFVFQKVNNAIYVLNSIFYCLNLKKIDFLLARLSHSQWKKTLQHSNLIRKHKFIHRKIQNIRFYGGANDFVNTFFE